MGGNVSITNKDGALTSQQAEKALAGRSLYKALSLFYGDKAGLKVLPTLVFLENSPAAVSGFLAKNGSPVMLRYDYTHLPQHKYVGGIPLAKKGVIPLPL